MPSWQGWHKPEMPYSLRESSSRNSRSNPPHFTHCPAASAMLRLRPYRLRLIASFASSSSFIMFKILPYRVGHTPSYPLNTPTIFSPERKEVSAGKTISVFHLRHAIRLACSKSVALICVQLLVPSLHVAILTLNNASLIFMRTVYHRR